MAGEKQNLNIKTQGKIFSWPFFDVGKIVPLWLSWLLFFKLFQSFLSNLKSKKKRIISVRDSYIKLGIDWGERGHFFQGVQGGDNFSYCQKFIFSLLKIGFLGHKISKFSPKLFRGGDNLPFLTSKGARGGEIFEVHGEGAVPILSLEGFKVTYIYNIPM